MHEDKKDLSENKKIQWHPGFYAATEIELHQNRKDLEFHREYNLSKKPLQIDLLIIEKLKDVQIQNEIGRLFRKYNIVEYKSPEDSLNIDDFFKTVGYAYLYKGLGDYVNHILLEELTVSLFHEPKPVDLMKGLIKYGCKIQRYAQGIYYVKGLLIPVQIIVTKELSPKAHSALKVLTKKLARSDLFEFMEYVNSFTEPCDKQNADAVLQVSVSANRKMYDQIRRSDFDMCEALRELFKDELEDAEKRGEIRGEMRGEKRGEIRGEMRGENRVILLYSKLKEDGREEELLQALNSPESRKELYKEYGIE